MTSKIIYTRVSSDGYEDSNFYCVITREGNQIPWPQSNSDPFSTACLIANAYCSQIVKSVRKQFKVGICNVTTVEHTLSTEIETTTTYNYVNPYRGV